MNENTRCRSCGKPILWAETEKGKRIPIDPTPVKDGNINLIPRDSGLPPWALTVSTKELDYFAHRDLFKSHFATCCGVWT